MRTARCSSNQLYSSQHSKGLFTPKAGILAASVLDGGLAGVKLFANISQGFRQTDGVIADPTLPFVTVWDYEAGVKFDQGSWAVDAALFRMDVSNEQSFDPALNTSDRRRPEPAERARRRRTRAARARASPRTPTSRSSTDSIRIS